MSCTVLEQHDCRDVLDPVLRCAFPIEDQTHFFERQPLTEADYLIKHAFREVNGFRRPEGLAEEKDRDRPLQG